MADNTVVWLAVIIILVSVIMLVISIVIIHATKDDPDPNKLDIGLIWLYIGVALVFLAGLITAIAAEITPNLCQLPYSGEYVPVESIGSGGINRQNVIIVPRKF